MSRSKIEAGAIYSLLVVTLVILGWMYIRLDNSVDDTAKDLLSEKSTIVHSKLDAFFEPVIQNLNGEWLRANQGYFKDKSQRELAKHFFSILHASPSISAEYISDEFGNQFYAGHLVDSAYKHRPGYFTALTTLGNETEIGPDNRNWTFTDDTLILDEAWTRSDSEFDPRTRPWFQSAMKTDSIVWTPPYMFEAAKIPGITISKKFYTDKTVLNVISLDITLADLSLLTTKIDVSENGKAFVLTESGELIGLPSFDQELSSKELLSHALTPVEKFEQYDVASSYEIWQLKKWGEETFEFTSDGEKYWANFSPYELGNLTFQVGIITPEEDIIGPIKRTKTMLLFGMIFIVFVSIVLVQAYRSKNKSNILLAEQKLQIEEQKHLVEEKNQEIIDSINYAKRIQSAILPQDDFFAQHLPKSFVVYEPKDIVAGDFYWMSAKNGSVLFAAADCTGHGVPGALVSVVCNNSLNRAVKEFDLSSPAEILDKTRELVVAEFEKSEEEVKDGMDIALCSLSGNTIQFAGAHNPIWIIKKGATEIEETKANKQPIGKFDEPVPYQGHTFDLNQGDRFYIFSDGFADQFGGEKGKKYKSSNFKRFLLSIQDCSIEEQKNKVLQEFHSWKGDYEQLDDVCVIGVEI